MTTARPPTRCHPGKVPPLDPNTSGHVPLKYGTNWATRLIRNAVNQGWHGELAHHRATLQLERVELWVLGNSLVSRVDVAYLHQVCCGQL